MKSWNNNKDVFENTGEKTKDHIWPTSKNGSPSNENIQIISKASNIEKGDRTRGSINGIRFSITEKTRTSAGKVIGKMKVKINGEWHNVEPSKQ